MTGMIGRSPAESNQWEVPMPRVAKIKALLGDSGGNVLDLRVASGFEFGHFPGAVSHPVSCEPTPETLEEELPSIFLPPRVQ